MNPLPDHHVHTEWSWDSERGSMEQSCRRAIDLGLPSIAFTEHADWSRGDDSVVDLRGYLKCIEDCRRRFPDLRILSGVELGEPHLHAESVREMLSIAPLDRVLGSVHFVRWGGEAADASKPGFLRREVVDEMFRGYLADVTAMLESDASFEVLAHLDYPKRYWPRERSYDEGRFEAEIRAALRAAARRGVALELNTTRGGPIERCLCPGAEVVKWWRQEGGRSLAFGSDAHSPDLVATGFDVATQVAEAAGFRPQEDPNGFWLA